MRLSESVPQGPPPDVKESLFSEHVAAMEPHCQGSGEPMWKLTPTDLRLAASSDGPRL